jgi:uncharacterized protein YbjQ (UPF0145 family)
MIVTTGNDVADRPLATYLGVVRGIVGRSPTIGQGIMGGLKTIVGGNNETYVGICETACKDAYNWMTEHAKSLGANAIIWMYDGATQFTDGVTEVLADGTAVKLAD